MKKLFAVLTALFLLVIVACSGGGGGGDGASSSNLTPEQIEKIESASEEITNKITTSDDSSPSTILEEAKSTALAQPSVESAEIIDGQLIVKYKDAGIQVVVLNTPILDDSDNLSEFEVTSKGYIVDRLNSIAPVSKGSTGTANAVLINSIDEDPAFVTIKSKFSTMKDTLTSIGYNVKTLYGTNASPDKMKELSDCSVIIMLGHGGRGDVSIQYAVQTGKPWDWSNISAWTSNEYVMFSVPWGEGDNKKRNKNTRHFYGITGNFWKKEYKSSHFNNALFMNLACSGSKYPVYREDLFSVGVIAYTGWSNPQSISPQHAVAMLNKMASDGKTFKEANDGLSDSLKTQEMDGVIATLWYGPESGYSLTLLSNTNNTSPYSISGTVSGAVTSGVTVALGGTRTATTTTVTGGTYSFSNLPIGSYTITPSLSGYTFSPTSKSVRVSIANVTGQNFTATATNTSPYSISGTVSGSISSGVTVALGGTRTATTTTVTGGTYSFSNLPSGSYTITPSLSGYTFSPTSKSVTVSNANVTGQSFTATATNTSPYSISGTVSGSISSGVTVALGGTRTATTTTVTGGTYSFSNLPSGSYTITPSLSGYTFSPTSKSVTVSNANVTGQSFTATANTIPTSGLVAYYPFNGDVNDASGNGHNGVNHGATATTGRTGNVSGALYFSNDTHDYVDVSAIAPSLAGHGEGTISLWFKAEITSAPLVYLGGGDFYLGEMTYSYDGESIGLLTTSGCVYNGYENGNAFYVDGNWHHAVAVMGTNFNAIYVDGNKLSLSEYIHGNESTGGCMWDPITQIIIGSTPPDFYEFTYKGSIDDVRFYNRALSASEITQLYSE